MKYLTPRVVVPILALGWLWLAAEVYYWAIGFILVEPDWITNIGEVTDNPAQRLFILFIGAFWMVGAVCMAGPFVKPLFEKEEDEETRNTLEPFFTETNEE